MGAYLVVAQGSQLAPKFMHLTLRTAHCTLHCTVHCTLCPYSQCKELGMGAYLGVAQGSELAPKFIHLTYRPSGAVTKKVALIGKVGSKV
jgi:leucyl aminopeptidase